MNSNNNKIIERFKNLIVMKIIVFINNNNNLTNNIRLLDKWSLEVFVFQGYARKR
jgi:hypothetical protein